MMGTSSLVLMVPSPSLSNMSNTSRNRSSETNRGQYGGYLEIPESWGHYDVIGVIMGSLGLLWDHWGVIMGSLGVILGSLFRVKYTSSSQVIY